MTSQLLYVVLSMQGITPTLHTGLLSMLTCFLLAVTLLPSSQSNSTATESALAELQALRYTEPEAQLKAVHARWKAQASATSAMMDDMREELSVLRAEKRDWDAKEAAGRVSRAEHDSVVADLASARAELTDLRMQCMCWGAWACNAPPPSMPHNIGMHAPCCSSTIPQ